MKPQPLASTLGSLTLTPNLFLTGLCRGQVEMKRFMTKKLFDRIDVDGNGTLDPVEMRALFQQLGLQLTPEQERPGLGA